MLCSSRAVIHLLFSSMMMAAWVVMSAMALIADAQARDDRLRESECVNESPIYEQAHFAAFTIQSYGGDHSAKCIQVKRNDVVLFRRRTEGTFRLTNGFGTSDAHGPPIPVGTDVTGSRVPEVVVSEWSGGGHCCYILRVLQLGVTVHEIAAMNMQDSDDGHFVDLDGDGVYEIVARDYTFAYWHASFADSPAPRVVLRFDGKAYRLALDLMRKPAPEKAAIETLIAEVRRKWEYDYPEPLLWKSMLELIYTGHPDLAWDVVSKASDGRNSAKDQFLSEFCGQLATSPYFAPLEPTLNRAPCKFEPKKGRRM